MIDYGREFDKLVDEYNNWVNMVDGLCDKYDFFKRSMF
jgi:hypothetical protein